jgi:anaerobic dimethyl sulfoxide reductase subunit C (anchor subunit)
MLREWPLVAFTILGQTAVGLFWFFHLPFLLHGRSPAYGWRGTWLAVLGVVALLAALGVLVSFFHLRHPVRARRALGNLRTSWLSREILFALVFLATVMANLWLGAFRDPGRGFQWGLLAAAGLSGALFLLSMARLYMLPSVPVWKGLYTPLTFLSTALVGGAVVTELVVRIVAGPGAFAIDLTTSGLVLLAGEIVLAAFATPRHGLCGLRPAPSLRPADGPPRLLHGARLAFLAAALACLAVDTMSGANDIMNERGAGPALWLAVVFVLVGEACGRFHYYGLAPRPGEPAL